MTPHVIKQYLNSTFSEFFGSVTELEQYITPSDLQYIYNYPSEIIIVKLWDFNVDLISLGKKPNDEYYVLDKNLQPIKTIYNSNNIAENREILDYAIRLNHADYFHIAFREQGKIKIILIWLVKQLPLLEKEILAQEWSRLKNEYQPTFYRTGELTIKNTYGGWLQIFYLPGEVTDRLDASSLLGDSKSNLLASSESSEIILNVPLNGWFAFMLILEDRVHLMTLSDIAGVGIHKVSVSNGLVYISLTGSLDAQSEGLDRLTTNKLSITAELTFALNYVNAELTTSINPKTLIIDYAN